MNASAELCLNEAMSFSDIFGISLDFVFKLSQEWEVEAIHMNLV